MKPGRFLLSAAGYALCAVLASGASAQTTSDPADVAAPPVAAAPAASAPDTSATPSDPAARVPTTSTDTQPPAAAPADNGNGLGEIIVQARRVNERLTDVPVAVTALSPQTLQQRNVTTVSDIQYAVPNLQIKPSTTNPTQFEFIIRGQRQTLFTDENVVTYVNGVPQGTRGITLYDLQSVQALKGPQGTLFGKNSDGGAMVFTTAPPEFKTTAAMQLEYGNYNLMRGQGMINIPISSNLALRIAGQVERRDGVYRNIYPGQKDLADRNNNSIRASLLGQFGAIKNTLVVDYLSRDENTAPAVIEAAYNDGRGLSAITRQAVINQSIYGGSTAVVEGDLLVRRGNPFRVNMLTGIGTTIPGTDFINTDASRVKDYGVANNTEFDLGSGLTFKNIFGYRYDRAVDQSDPGGVLGQTYDFSTFNPFLTAPGQFVDNNVNYLNRTRQLTEEAQLILNSSALKAIAGAFYSHTNFLYAVNSFLGLSQDFGPFGIFPVSFYPDTGRHGETTTITNSYAAFAQGTYDFSGVGVEGLRLTLGGRYTWNTRDFTGSNFFTPSNAQQQTFAPGYICNQVNDTLGNIVSVNDGTQCYEKGKRKFNAFTYTASLEYKLNPNTLLYAATRHGFKAGGPTPTTRNLDFLFFGNEKLTDYELGFKTSSRFGSVPVRFNIAAFLGNYKGIQTQDIVTFCANPAEPAATCATASGAYTDLIILNVGKATIKGVELDTSIKPFRDLTVDVGYSYQKTKYGKGSVIPQPTIPSQPVANDNPINLAGGTDITGLPFAGVAKQTLTANVSYAASFIPESFAKVTIGGNYSYRTKTSGIPVQGVFRTPSFGIFGTSIAFANLFESPMSLTLWGQNITNRRYKLYCADNLDSLGYAACRWGEPRTYGGTLTFKF